MKLAEIANHRKNLTESTDSNGIDLWDSDAKKPVIIPWKDKDRIIHYMLLVRKHHQNDSGAMEAVLRWIKTSRDRGYDYPEFKSIEKSIGEKGIREAKEDEGIRPWYEAHEYWDPKLIKFSDKRELLRFLLMCVKKTTSSVGSFYEKRIPLWIKRSRDAGYDYPEFKTIEKSLTVNESEDEIFYRSADKNENYKFSDKEKFLKFLLQRLKTNSGAVEARMFIKMSRKAGYDYPEFKSIEKSINVT